MGIETVKQRQALKPRREPYWHMKGKGQHVGYRRTPEGGTWIARAYDPATRSRSYHALGDLRDVAGSDQFTEASRLAGEWFRHLGMGGNAEILTIRNACERYVDHLRRRKGAAPAVDAAGRFERHVYPDKLAAVPLPKLTARHLTEWRDRLAAKPAVRAKRGPNCRVKTPLQASTPRSASALNRDMSALRAALNLAHLEGYATNDLAWRQALRPAEKADRRRELYLDRNQRRALLDAAAEDVRPFLQGLCLLPLRPGALAALTVQDFDSRAGALKVDSDKAGGGRKILLPPATADLLRQLARGKTPKAPLFARWDGRPWDRDAWKGPVKAAAATADLPPDTTAYTLRHSTITDLVVAGLDLFTVAQLSGTSVAMIERHYGHLQQQRAQEALKGLAL